MRTIEDIKKEQEDKLNALFDEYGIFFAFSKAQFEENKKEGVTYADRDYGMIIPLDNVELFNKKFEEHCNETESLIRTHIEMDEYIYRQLADCECFYSGDYLEVFVLVKEIYPACTVEDVKRVYYEHIK